jgi:hypothetical protein
MQSKSSRGLLLAAIILIALGIVLLLNNFLLISGFNVLTLSPLILVIAGAFVLLRGDLPAREGGNRFSLTRGSVEAAQLEISAGEIDTAIQPLQRKDRLIAGAFAEDSLPQLVKQDNTAFLRLARSHTPWRSFSDWTLAINDELPWSIYATASLGQINFNLSTVIVQRATVASGLGDILFTCPAEAFEPLTLRSTAGTIRVVTPPASHCVIRVHPSRVSKLVFDEMRYEQVEPNTYRSRGRAQNRVEIDIHPIFGDVYLA